MKLIQNKNKTFLIQFLFILLINFFLTIQNEIQFQYQTSLFPSEGEEYDLFGKSVSISNDGNILLIGTSYSGANPGQGKAYIFQKNGTIWNQTQILIASDGEAEDTFGTSVSISNDGNIILIGAPSSDVENNTNQGKAYIFQKNGTIWNQSQILIASDGEQYDTFGDEVSISNDGNILFVGASGATVANKYAQGKAYIFQKNGNEWNQTQILIASDGGANDCLGRSISISNDSSILLIGALCTDKAYIFQKNGNEWNQIKILIASDGTDSDEFGWSVSVSNDGNIILIGAPQATIGSNTSQGKAYIFQKNGNEWNQIQILIASDGQANDRFGYSVSISNDGNFALIGATYATVANKYAQGKVYIFQKNGNEWNQIQILIGNDGQKGDCFGWSVSISNDYAIISATQADSKKGETYIFSLTNIISSSSSSSISLSTIIVVSTAIPIIVIIGVILAIVFIKRKKRRKNEERKNNNHIEMREQVRKADK